MTTDSMKCKQSAVITIDNEEELLQHGISRVKLPSSIQSKLSHYSKTLSRVTPMNTTSEDGEYAFYRNIKEDTDNDTFPFDAIIKEDVYNTLKMHFNIDDPDNDIYLDDAFCIQYNMKFDDTTCAKHMDPSDITINICLESDNVTGSQVVFYGVQTLDNVTATSTSDNDDNDEYEFLVDQKEGYCTIHYGKHPHKTLPLLSGQRTNVILTYCYKDNTKTDVSTRTCYL